ncbi:MAG: hypothetical protein MUO42_02835 [Anaerolineaceae bacterium]|jgi:hypothetical protein|nr:hypothetical protein [Anaerolineaceae bacterium]
MLRHFNAPSSPRSQIASPEYSRILSAAVINNSFRQMLLKDPINAVCGGYSGEEFNLNSEDKNRLASIRAASLADFAAQLSQI